MTLNYTAKRRRGTTQKERIKNKNTTSSKSIKGRFAPNSQPNSQHTSHTHAHTQKNSHIVHALQNSLSYPIYTHYKTPHSSTDSLNISSGSQRMQSTHNTHTHTKTKTKTKHQRLAYSVWISLHLSHYINERNTRWYAGRYVCMYV